MDLKWLSAPLLIFFVLNTSFQIYSFGINGGTYFWFCNLALLLGGFGIALRKKDLLLLTLAILLPTQFFWYVDHIIRTFTGTGTDVFGLSEALYHPGASHFAFLLGHYHFFLTPTLLYSFFLMSPRKGNILKGLCLLALVALPLSHFAFPYEQNINCSQFSCIDFLNRFEGTTYVLLFTLIVFMLAYLTGKVLTSKVFDYFNTGILLRAGYISALLLGAAITGLGYQAKRKTPSFSCLGPFETETVRIQCKFLLDHTKDWMDLHYEVMNKTPVIQECSSFIEVDGKRELFQNGLTIPASSPLKVSILFHYPVKDTAIQLTAECRPL